tara:strand:+ start:73 stop:534 length:462 start_codon:yes stop_codon:yes gene_type:complete
MDKDYIISRSYIAGNGKEVLISLTPKEDEDVTLSGRDSDNLYDIDRQRVENEGLETFLLEVRIKDKGALDHSASMGWELRKPIEEILDRLGPELDIYEKGELNPADFITYLRDIAEELTGDYATPILRDVEDDFSLSDQEEIVPEDWDNPILT